MMTGWYTDGGDGAAARPRSSSQVRPAPFPPRPALTGALRLCIRQATDAPAPGPATHGRPRAASSAAQVRAHAPVATTIAAAAA